ncbi:helix-turn-helix domain-containing protein [Streptomyces albireticuli]|uniref:Transcriptional regulator n=2 Tax=Streptomyces albireticuli TaxID=1940 RepID=A0A2A2D081_9ACTN|nr:helix-turn-helix transcriptional regulator [Streptomyces albireticuli]MCD9143627.1 helix-turn-helix domain-containing protein [Streptomyces albireticuli]MCD9161942.1 helix-turn-helix domain-containing protein [Streptomyces albireticuli]MCD9191744.1 helix-turn-helix domain-containing protein [Streptomyces albireticuli]PAU44742.1 transcriptional regulator [Streptomyces albireticuli]
MPPRTAPTGRQQRLGAELRKMREQAGLSPVHAGRELGADRTRISNTEAGRLGLSPERIRTFAQIYSCPDNKYISALVAMTDERGKGWWEEYRGSLSASMLDLAELEYHATGLTVLQLAYIPGLLQTEEYARSLFQNTVPPLAPIDVERRVSFRMQRKCVMQRTPATPHTFMIHECALRMLHAGVDGQRRQLDRLIEVSGHEGVTIRVIPFAAGSFPGANTSATYAEGAVPKLDTVQIDTAHGSLFLDAEAHLENYRSILRYAKKTALGPKQSRDFIRSIANQL